MTIDDAHSELHRDLGLKRLSGTWAKLEILLGLTVAVGGLLYGIDLIAEPGQLESWVSVLPSIVLQVLGLYLAMAGHRSHIYQSQNKLTAYLCAKFSTGDKSQN